MNVYEDGKKTMEIEDRKLEPLLKKGTAIYEKMQAKTKGVFTHLKTLLDQESVSSTKINTEGKAVDLTDDIFTAVISVFRHFVSLNFLILYTTQFRQLQLALGLLNFMHLGVDIVRT